MYNVESVRLELCPCRHVLLMQFMNKTYCLLRRLFVDEKVSFILS